MAGHSKWKNIKHKKAITDGAKTRKFTKLSRDISIAARVGGGDISANPTLRTLIEKAHKINMPKENYLRAIKRGVGGEGGKHYETSFYEGYGPGNISIIVEAISDNKNHAAAEIRRLFNHNGGSIGESGTVSWMFDKCGLIEGTHENMSEETLLELLLPFKIIDIKIDEETKEILIAVQISDLNDAKEVLLKSGMEIEEFHIGYHPKDIIHISAEEEEKAAKFLSILDDAEDIQRFYTNL